MPKKSDRYNSNPLVPKAGVERAYTPKQLREVNKCMSDPIYFAKKYFKVISLDDGLIDFDLYEYQEEAITKFMKSRNMILNASRQSGKTSVVTVIVLHSVMFNPMYGAAILANKGATSREILHRIKRAYEYLPDFLKPGVKEWNKSKVEFENGSTIMAEASSSDNVRGQSINLLYIDELAFVEGWEDFSASVLPTLSSGNTTKMVFSSTPHGLNHFYEYVEGARNGNNGFELVEVPWQRVPGRDEAWKQHTLHTEMNGDVLKFAQEYELEFQGSSGTLISGSCLKALSKSIPVQYDEHTRQYAAPEDGHEYALVADVSRGKGLDYSAFSVIDITEIPYKQVMTYRNNLVTPTDYATTIFHTAILYKNALVLIEINDLGQQVADFIHDLEYENIIYTENKGRAGKQISAGFGKNVDRGIRTTLSVKALGCANAKLLIEGYKLEINDKWTIDELKTFSAKNKSYEAEVGKHDDMVMGLVLFSWLSVQPYFKNLTDTDVMEALKERTEEQMMSELTPFGIIDDGLAEEHPMVIDVVADNWLSTDLW